MTNTANSIPDESQRHDGDHKVAVGVLFERLSHGWRTSSADVARDFVARWADGLACDVEIKEVGDSFIRFSADLGSIRFAGMDNIACLLVSGGDGAREAASDFWRKTSAPGKAALVIALSMEAHHQASAALPAGRYALLGPSATLALLGSPSPLCVLRLIIRDQVPLRRLIPFDTEHPVEGHMFQGRSRLIARIFDEEYVSFAIAGPGRIGKTSLMKRYLDRVVRARDGSRVSKFYIDLMPCPERTPDALARFIALKIDSTRKASQLTCDRLEQFLMFWREHFGRPVDLLLDETDDFVHLDTFRYLGTAARKGYCRIVLGGRGILLRTILGAGSTLQHRIELLRLDPLTDAETADLLLRPLEDLGCSIHDPHRVIELVGGLTGKLPHFIQFYGRRIAEMWAGREASLVDQSVVFRVRDEFETAKLFTDPIFEVKSPRARFVALSLLGATGKPMSLSHIQGVVYHQGLALDLDELRDIVNELVIQNVLAWNQGRYQVANESLPHYAHSQEIVGPAMRQVRAHL